MTNAASLKMELLMSALAAENYALAKTLYTKDLAGAGKEVFYELLRLRENLPIKYKEVVWLGEHFSVEFKDVLEFLLYYRDTGGMLINYIEDYSLDWEEVESFIDTFGRDGVSISAQIVGTKVRAVVAAPTPLEANRSLFLHAARNLDRFSQAREIPLREYLAAPKTHEAAIASTFEFSMIDRISPTPEERKIYDSIKCKLIGVGCS